MRSELFWLAFRYVSGELTPAEADAFERRLDHDQQAREAVAEAVGLASCVASLPAETPQVLSLHRGRSFRSLVVLAAAVAACVLVAVGLHLRSPGPDEAPGARRSSSSAAGSP